MVEGELDLLVVGSGVGTVAAAYAPFADAISLEVTIVADPDQQIDRPDEAAYLAQASQEGGGNTAEQVRPSAPAENASPVDNPGDETGDSFVESTEHQVSADQLLATSADQQRSVTDDPRVAACEVEDDQLSDRLRAMQRVRLMPTGEAGTLPESPSTETAVLSESPPRPLRTMSTTVRATSMKSISSGGSSG